MIARDSDEARWRESELAAMSGVFTWLRAREPLERLLDAGCGSGRLLPLFGSHAREICAVDHDVERLDAARELGSRARLGNVQFVDTGIDQLDARIPRRHRSFDLVVCSHVLQHVPTTRVLELVVALASLVSCRGRLVLTTAYTSGVDDFVACDWSPNGEIREQLVCESEFNRRLLVERGLGAHRFTLRSLNRLLTLGGLRVLETRPFHVLGRPEERRRGAGALVGLERRARVASVGRARDVLLVAERIEAGERAG